MLTLRIAWRNIWRNGKRTSITVAAVGLNTAVLITTFALIEGMTGQMINSATQLIVGDGQVHAQGYLEDRSIYKAIANPERVMEAAQKAGLSAAPRSFGIGLVSSGPKSAGASFWGVDPMAEKSSFKLPTKISEGTYLTEEPRAEVVLGRKIAKSLHVEIGSELVAVVQAADGSLGNELLTVIGILSAVGDEIDRAAVIMHADDFETLFVSNGRIHEIALNSFEREPVSDLSNRIGTLGKNDVVHTWRQILPILSDMLILNNTASLLFAIIFFLAAGLGVMNTMLMATHDRIREFGVLKALGTPPWRIIVDVAAEAFMLGLVATFIGTLIGVGASIYFQQVGIDLRLTGDLSVSFGGVAMEPVWRAVLNLTDVFRSVTLMLLTCVLVSLYPAIRASRLDPAIAMTTQ